MNPLGLLLRTLPGCSDHGFHAVQEVISGNAAYRADGSAVGYNAMVPGGDPAGNVA